MDPKKTLLHSFACFIWFPFGSNEWQSGGQRMPAIGTFGGNHGRCPYLGGSALPVPWGGSSYMRWIYPDGSALPILEAVSLPRTRRVSVRAGSFKQPGWQALSPVTFPPSSQVRLMSGIKPTHAPAYQGKYLDQLISEWNWKLSTIELKMNTNFCFISRIW